MNPRNIFLYFSAVIAATAMTAACSGEKKSNDIIVQKVEAPKPQPPIKMQDYSMDKDVEWLGKQYHIEIRRKADDSLQMVKDENQQMYVDNRISLRVIRQDGSLFFQKLITKDDFTSALDDDYRQTGILEGFVFDNAKNNELRFAASVCHPQAEDEYIPLVMTLDNFGNIRISRDTQLDTSGEDEDDEV